MVCETDGTISQADLDKLAADAAFIDDWVEGGPADEIATPGGQLIPSPSKVIADAKLFKDPAAYNAGTQYTDATVPVIESGIVYAPQPAALPIGPEAFNAANWYVLQGFTSPDVGTVLQAWHANLDALAALASVANLEALADLASVANLEALEGSLAGIGISGMQTANNVGDSDHDIDITAGRVPDSTGSVFLIGTGQTKQIDATWATGTNAGGLASALTLAADTWYHLFITDDGAGGTEYGWDTSTTSANLLADTGGTKYSYLMSHLTDASSNITAYRQFRDRVAMPYAIDVSAVDPGTSQQFVTVTAPLGYNFKVLLNVAFENTTVAGNDHLTLQDGDAPNVSAGNGNASQTIAAGANKAVSDFERITDTTSRIWYRLSDSEAATVVTVRYRGFEIDRGVV